MKEICVRFLKYCVAFIALFLSMVSLLFTQRLGQEQLGEILNGAPIYEIQDNICYHLLGIMVVIILFLSINKFLEKVQNRDIEKYIKIFRGMVAIIVGILSVLILLGGMRQPVDDQIQVIGAAMLFNEGNYLNLVKGGYINMYPQQLGYVFFLQIVFRIFGNGNYFAVQLINCLFIAGISYYISKLINILTKKTSYRVMGTLGTLCLLPLMYLCSWVYGDVPCIFFSFVLIYQYILFNQNKSIKHMTIMVLSSCLCLIFRKNSLIILIAMGIVSIVQFALNKNKKILLGVMLACIFPLLCTQAIEHQYQEISGYEVDGGLPSIMWITMGAIEGASKPGWFNNYGVSTYYDTQCDQELSKELAKEELISQLSDYINNPIKGISFYKRKICTQWNDPFYGCNSLLHVEDDAELRGISSYLAENEKEIRTFLSVFQFIIYSGLLLYMILCFEKKEFYHHIIIVIILGGFLFSILWEANSRYVFPYFVMMFPVAIQGWGTIISKISGMREMER